jgi:hypothetical protein
MSFSGAFLDLAGGHQVKVRKFHVPEEKIPKQNVPDDGIFECYYHTHHIYAKDEDLKKMRWCQSSRDLEYAVQHYFFQDAIKEALWIEDIRAYNHKFGIVSDSQASKQKVFLKRLIVWILRNHQRKMRRQIFPKEIVKIIINIVVAFLKVPFNYGMFWIPPTPSCDPFYLTKCCKKFLSVAKLQRAFPMFPNGIGNRIYDMWFEELVHPYTKFSLNPWTFEHKSYTKEQTAIIKRLLEERSDFFNTLALMNPCRVPSSVYTLSHLNWWPNADVFHIAIKKQIKGKKNSSKRQRKIIKRNYQKPVKPFNFTKGKRPKCKKERWRK